MFSIGTSHQSVYKLVLPPGIYMWYTLVYFIGLKSETKTIMKDNTMKTTSSRTSRTDAVMNSQILTAHTRPDRIESVGEPAVREGSGS